MSQLDALFDEIEETFGTLNVFVSNAATGVIGDLDRLDDRAWRWSMDANAHAFLLGAKRAAALMAQSGRMIAISSRSLAAELAPREITVNVVSPGVMDTDALTHFPQHDAILAALERTPAGRLTQPEDVADAIGFLTSDAAGMITAQTVVVDGGASLMA